MFAPYMLLIRIVGVLAMLGALTYAWHEFTNKYVQQGVEQQLKIDKPKIEGLTAEVTAAQNAYAALSEVSNRQTNQINQLGKAAQQAKKNYAEAVKHGQSIAATANADKVAVTAIPINPNANCASRLDSLGKIVGAKQ